MPSARSSRPGRLMAVFALSGFSGLIYQSIWSHYLGLTLGHAAYAQTLVLAIFMGGLALGSWLASRRVTGLANPIMAYAGIELLIGLFALAFHPAFLAYTDFSQVTVLPQLSSGLVHLYQWGTAALLILPQCVLLGTTFPLMAAGCLRSDAGEQGRSLGGLYFSNSLGAAVGALLATFLLLPWVGMPGAMVVAGLVNLGVAALAWGMSRPGIAQATPAPVPAASASPPAAPGRQGLLIGVLVAAGITGATSFVYEIVWVRMLNMALGTTLHAFELMLAAFILGLAAGGYWIHRRGDASGNTLRLAGISQVLMGVCALGSALAFSQSFRWVGWLVRNLPHTEAGYGWFNLGSVSVALLVMFPAAFFAGSTLPLFTMSLLRQGHGERAVGRVYAANTLGAIIGVFAVVHLLIPGLGLHLSLLLAALLDIVLGIALLAIFGGASAERDKRVALLAGVAMLAIALLYGRTDPLVQSSGVFRTGYLLGPQDASLRFMADGKTATVSVLESVQGDVMTIATNGKPDAGLAPALEQRPLGDEVTMILMAALPLALHPAPKDVGAIGWGSGLTTHTMLGSGRVQRMETVEIEPAMYAGARNFGSRVSRAYLDPRSQVVFDDARTYFSAGRKRYDVLISEPSNPWVSGVASLFTEEFYGFLRQHLVPGGIFVQWIQSYEMNDRLQARMMAALLKRFPYVDVYLSNGSDFVFVASSRPIPAPDWSGLRYSPLDAELARVGLDGLPALAIRRVGGRKVLEAYVRMYGAEGHSDFYPVVALGAPKSRFLGETAGLLPLLVQNGMPVLDLLDGRRPLRRGELASEDSASSFVAFEKYCGAVVDGLTDPRTLPALRARAPDEAREIERVLVAAKHPIPRLALPAWSTDLAALARYGIGALDSEDLHASWVEPQWLAPGQGPEVDAVMAAYRAAALRDARAMHARAVAVLELRAGLAPELRQQMLAIAMAGAAAEHEFGAVRSLQARYGAAMPQDDDYAKVRRFIVAWASGGP